MAADPTPWIAAVRSSHERFVGLVEPLSAERLGGPSYDPEWTIAQVASHLGSQAEIFGLLLDAGLTGSAPPGGEAFGPIWDRWNALAPQQQAERSVAANAAFVDRLEAVPEQERAAFDLELFGAPADLAQLAAVRLTEHALHTWDIAVELDHTATVAQDAVDLLIDDLDAAVDRSGRAVEGEEPVEVATVDPDRMFHVKLDPPLVRPGSGPAELTLPAEAFLRLIYGRLDPEHTPASARGAAGADRLGDLRRTFRGY